MRDRVVHLVPALFDVDDGVTGGAERYVLELARHMADVAPTRLVTFGARDRNEHVGRLEIRVLGGSRYLRGQRGNPLHAGLFGALRPARVIHCHQQHVVSSSLAAVYGRLTRRPTFVTDLGGGGWDISGYVSTDRWYRGHLHISEFSRRVFGHADKPWARVILGGVDAARFAPPKERPSNWGSVLFVGRLLPHKGIDDLIDALPEGLDLVVLGREADAGFLDDLERLAAGKRVTFVRDANDEMLLAAYHSARCLVLPSVYRDRYGGETPVPELLGQTLLEAMATSVPVIATDVASLPEVVAHEVTGFIVPPNDVAALRQKLGWLRDHPQEATAMGAAGRERVLTHFTWPRVVERCLTAYGDQ